MVAILSVSDLDRTTPGQHFLSDYLVNPGNQVTRLIEPTKTKSSILGNPRFTFTPYGIVYINKVKSEF